MKLVYGFQYRGNGYGFWDTYEDANNALQARRQKETDSRYRNVMGVIHKFEIVAN